MKLTTPALSSVSEEDIERNTGTAGPTLGGSNNGTMRNESKDELAGNQNGIDSSSFHYPGSSTDDTAHDGCSGEEFEDEEADGMDSARKVAQQETARLRIWRFVVTDTIIMIAVVLILTTYTVQREAEHVNFAESYTQLANAAGARVMDQQQVLRSSLLEFAATASSSAELVYNPWPLFTLPHFETHAQRVKAVSAVDALGLFSMVSREDRTEWVDFADQTHPDIVLYNNRIAGTEDDLQPVGYHSYITRRDTKGELVQDWNRDVYFPALAWSPPPLDFATINWNLASDAGFRKTIQVLMDNPDEQEVLYTFPHDMDPLFPSHDETEEPFTYALTPVYQQEELSIASNAANESSQFVGVISSAFTWDHMFTKALPQDVNGLVAVLRSTNCLNKVSSYVIDGVEATYLGPQDMHDTKFDKYVVEVDLSSHYYQQPDGALNATGHCTFVLELYPTDALWDRHVTYNPEIYALVLSLLFFLIAVVYFVYDKLVDGRNEKLVSRFALSNAIVSSLFPKNIQDRLLGQVGKEDSTGGNHTKRGSLKAFMSGGATSDNLNDMAAKPLADLFPEVSIMFADLVGFTAWSSVREPNQVFILLETLYSAFDDIAATRRIFKVETVGDCYVAAAGLPNPRRDHAVALVRFATDINQKMQVLTKELEVMLGPDTGDLALRVGINSGPVTAGILRGKKARFQLFGDAMNTTSRLETTGMPGRIHISQATADLLIKSGKSHWVTKRSDLVAAKGKGVMQTYWVTSVHGADGESTASGSSRNSGCSKELVKPRSKRTVITKEHDLSGLSERVDRLVEWNVGALLHLLKEIIARRDAENKVEMESTHRNRQEDQSGVKSPSALPLEEVKEIITLPEFNRAAARRQRNPEQVELPSLVVDQLRNLVRRIASMYRDNHFHNFEHASHVTMSVTKLLSRIVAPTDLEITVDADEGGAAATLHDHTYGITSDPMTQFACVFSALIHDVDHTGVPNAQLVKEGAEIAAFYKNRSVAEQNSFDLSWALFMDSSFDALRATLCATPAEVQHFRELVVNCVMATDIVDKELKALRNARWQKAFDNSPDKRVIESNQDVLRSSANRKATIVIEHLLQASDVAHTMQHWHIYRKWNERFFLECYKAYLDGRAASDPREHWYQGEIGFFDFYIIPLAKKLKDCGVFGVSSDEYLIYAQNNRDEWESRGKEIVQDFIEKAEAEFGVRKTNTPPISESGATISDSEHS